MHGRPLVTSAGLQHHPLPPPQAGDLNTARDCLRCYFAEGAAAAAGSAVLPPPAPPLPPQQQQTQQQQQLLPRDQHAVRALFAAGRLVARAAAALKGRALVDATLEAARLICEGIDVAVADPRLAFLVQNGAVCYCQAVHGLQRDGVRSRLLSSQERVCSVRLGCWLKQLRETAHVQVRVVFARSDFGSLLEARGQLSSRQLRRSLPAEHTTCPGPGQGQRRCGPRLALAPPRQPRALSRRLRPRRRGAARAGSGSGAGSAARSEGQGAHHRLARAARIQSLGCKPAASSCQLVSSLLRAAFKPLCSIKKSQQEVAGLAMHISCTAAPRAGVPAKAGGAAKGAQAGGPPPPPLKPTPAAAGGGTTAAGAATTAGGAGTATAGRKAGKPASGGGVAKTPAAASEAAAPVSAVQQPVCVPQADEDAALAAVQWVLSSRPELTGATQQLKEAWLRVSGPARRFACAEWMGANQHGVCSRSFASPWRAGGPPAPGHRPGRQPASRRAHRLGRGALRRDGPGRGLRIACRRGAGAGAAGVG